MTTATSTITDRSTTARPALRTVPETGPVEREHTYVRVGDDVTLAATWHRPLASDVDRGVAVVAPGVAVPARKVHALADALARRGWTAITFDYAGMGDSADGHARGRRRDLLSDWGRRDLDGVIRTAVDEADGRPVVLVGHSAGAWLVGLTPTARDLDAVVGLASMAGYWGNFADRQKPAMLGYWYLMFPVVTRLLGFIPGAWGLGLDLPGGVGRQWARWNRRPGFYPSDPRLAFDLHLEDLRVPVIDLLPTDDEWATPAAARAMWEQFPNAEVSYVSVGPRQLGVERLGHLGLLGSGVAEPVADLVDGALVEALGTRAVSSLTA